MKRPKLFNKRWKKVVLGILVAVIFLFAYTYPRYNVGEIGEWKLQMPVLKDTRAVSSSSFNNFGLEDGLEVGIVWLDMATFYISVIFVDWDHPTFDNGTELLSVDLFLWQYYAAQGRMGGDGLVVCPIYVEWEEDVLNYANMPIPMGEILLRCSPFTAVDSSTAWFSWNVSAAYSTDVVDPPPLTVETVDATFVKTNSVDLRGEVVSMSMTGTVDTNFELKRTIAGRVDSWMTNPVTLDVPGEFVTSVAGLVPETFYEYRATAVHVNGETAYGEWLNFTTLEYIEPPIGPPNPPCEPGDVPCIEATEPILAPAGSGDDTNDTDETVPSAPRNLVATAGVNQVGLEWQVPLSNGTGSYNDDVVDFSMSYKVYRGTASTSTSGLAGVKTFIADTGTNLSYLDKKAVAGETYYYQVGAENLVGESVRSNEASAVPTAFVPILPGAIPTGFVMMAVTGDHIFSSKDHFRQEQRPYAVYTYYGPRILSPAERDSIYIWGFVAIAAVPTGVLMFVLLRRFGKMLVIQMKERIDPEASKWYKWTEEYEYSARDHGVFGTDEDDDK